MVLLCQSPTGTEEAEEAGGDTGVDIVEAAAMNDVDMVEGMADIVMNDVDTEGAVDTATNMVDTATNIVDKINTMENDV